MTSVLVYGLAVTGTSVTRALKKRGIDVICVDDNDTEDNRQIAIDLDVETHFSPTPSELEALIRNCDYVVPAPGVRETHAVRLSAVRLGKDCVSELDLAYEWEGLRAGGPRPMLAITGTDGKTTTTSLTAHILRTSGLRVVEAGNTEIPLVDAIESDADVFVVECSSFRLATTKKFRAKASAWLNFSPDHLDWHTSLDSYFSAKRKIWSHLIHDDVAVYPKSDENIAAAALSSGARSVSYGLGGNYDLATGGLRVNGEIFCSVAQMWRALPHDIDNSLAASALAVESGLSGLADAAEAIRTFVPPHHRIELIAEENGVRWYDDSKATTPHAARAAIRSFESVVLIAGGRNKALDLSELAIEKSHIKAVVATGEAVDELMNAFAGICKVHPASSMMAAVSIANDLAGVGDTVLLSPACTSFDWYRNYNERGDDFVRCVRNILSGKMEESK